MNYDELRDAWRRALAESRLSILGFEDEAIDLHSMGRCFKVHVEPQGGQRSEPFFVAATLSWQWTALQTMRGQLCEEDVLTALLGRRASHTDTARPWLRVDVTLRAHVQRERALPMPGKAAWSRWAREALGRLEGVERLLPAEVAEEDADGGVAVLAWQDAPAVHLVCSPAGELRLHAVELSAWQAVDLPRRWDDADREHDERPDGQLAGLLARVRASLFAWMDVLDHLLPA